MNYERIISARKSDSHTRKVHVAAQYSAMTLCGKTVNRQYWRSAIDQDTSACGRCAELLRKITGGKPASPLKIVSLNLTDMQYEVISSLKNGETLTQIDKRMGWGHTANTLLRNVCRKSNITVPELRAMLPYIQPINPASKKCNPPKIEKLPIKKIRLQKPQKPLVYQIRHDRFRALLWDGENRKTITLGYYATRDEGETAWWHAKKNGIYMPGQGVVMF